MKNKGPLIAMIALILFAAVMFIRPWTFFQNSGIATEPVQEQDESAGEGQPQDLSQEQAADQVDGAGGNIQGTESPDRLGEIGDDNVPVDEGEDSGDKKTDASENSEPIDQPHDPANLYDIESSDFMN